MPEAADRTTRVDDPPADDPHTDDSHTGDSHAGESERARVRHAWRVMVVVGLASVLVALNQSTLNVALPAVVRHFSAGPLAASWVLLSYQLANTVFLVVFGRMADILGRRGMYIAGITGFTLSSLLQGFAPNIGILIGFRLIQGTSAALLLANSVAIVAASFPKRLLSRAMGVYFASFSVAQLVGPTAGGVLADGLGWQWVFWINVPVGLACLVMGLTTLRKVSPGPREGLDLPGNMLFLVALTCLIIGLSEVGTLGWGSPLVSGTLAAFVVLLAAFLLVERRAKSPVLDLRLFRDRSFTAAIASAFINMGPRFAVTLLIALYFQAVHGDTAIEAGLKVMPIAVGTMAGSLSLGLLARWLNARAACTLAALLVTAGLVCLLALVGADQSYPPVGAALLLCGLGSGIFVSANTTAIMQIAPANRLGIANAVRMMIQNVAMAASTALVLAVAASHLPVGLRDQVFGSSVGHLSAQSLEGLLAGHREALLLLIVLAILGTVASFYGQVAFRREHGGRVMGAQAAAAET